MLYQPACARRIAIACKTEQQSALFDVVQVNFAYKEAGEHKQALVKLRLCPKHALQLNHKQNHKLIKKRKREQHEQQDQDSKLHAKIDGHKSGKGSKGSSRTDDASEKDEETGKNTNQSSKAVAKKAENHKYGEEFEGLFD